MSYTKLNLEQGSPEWIEARFNYLTASQAPVLFDISRYMTRLQLFEEKVLREERADNKGKEILFARGHNAEKAAREYVERATGLKFNPAVIVSNRHPWMLASLDGFNEENKIIFEGKFVGREALLEIRHGKIPPDHLCQIQAALLISGALVCKYFATDPDGDSHIVDILPDAEYGQRIASQAELFIEEHVKKGEPPELSDRDFYTPQDKDPRFDILCALKKELDEAQLKYDALRNDLVKGYADYKRVRYNDVTIVRSIRKGNIQYAKVPVLKGIDLEPYRAKDSEVVTVKVAALKKTVAA